MQTIIHKCPHCGTDKTTKGQPFKNVSALNTHINVHCPKKPVTISSGHNHAWKLLNPNKVDHARALQAGYTKHCEGCGDVE